MKPIRFSPPTLAAALLLGLASSASAQTAPEKLLLRPNLQTDRPASLDEPLTFPVAELASPKPTWNAQGIWIRPAGLHGLAKVLDASPANDPVWDPGSQAWYAFAYGTLVRVEPEGSLPVVLDSLPGHDFDVRAARGLVVYRDPNSDQIVLQRFGQSTERRVLLAGDFYNPRFSPDGTQVAVSQLKNGGGHLWLVETETGTTRDLGKGNDPAWRPDGRQLLFLRLEDNGHELTASHLFLHEPASGATRFLATARKHLVTRPAFSPDGSWIAFVDEASGQVMAARLPKIGAER